MCGDTGVLCVDVSVSIEVAAVGSKQQYGTMAVLCGEAAAEEMHACSGQGALDAMQCDALPGLLAYVQQH